MPIFFTSKLNNFLFGATKANNGIMKKIGCSKYFLDSEANYGHKGMALSNILRVNPSMKIHVQIVFGQQLFDRGKAKTF